MARKKQPSRETERSARTRQVEQWIGQGFSKATIRTMIEEKFGLRSYSAQNRLIGDSLKQVMEEVDPQTARQLTGERLDSLLEKALEKDNIREARMILDQISKLNGLYVAKAEVTVVDTFKCEI